MYDIVTVGEGMLRLSPPDHGRLRRAASLDLHICGSQGNVAANVARLGGRSAFVTQLPNNALGLLMLDFYRSCGVDVSHIKLIDDSRVGVNFIEFGSTPRSHSVIYDRKRSAASAISPGAFDWNKILGGSRIAYTDGIFPGLSDCCEAAAAEFIEAAKHSGCLVAFDVNYREHLWPPEKACAVLSKIIEKVDVLITTQWDSETVFGYEGSYEDIGRKFHDSFGCRIVALTLREVHGVEKGAWNALVCADGKVVTGEKIEIDIVDRFGAGDSWGSAFLYTYITRGDVEYSLHFANAFCALHHTVPGDVAHVSPEEVTAIMGERRDFRVKR
jgi:2-dehydro-3-deoxygluconokinase